MGLDTKTTKEIIITELESWQRSSLNKKWTSNESLIKELRTIIGGHLIHSPQYTLEAIKGIVVRL